MKIYTLILHSVERFIQQIKSSAKFVPVLCQAMHRVEKKYPKLNVEST